ncbi:hypothetical protein ACX9MO_18230 [Pseudooceanicola sp. 502str34]
MTDTKAKAPEDRTTETSDQLRDEIDRGGTGDKVAFSDPAAAPLGTDDEAGGHPPDPDQVRRAAAHETPRANPEDRKKGPAELQGSRLSPRLLVVAAVSGIALIVVVLAL